MGRCKSAWAFFLPNAQICVHLCDTGSARPKDPRQTSAARQERVTMGRRDELIAHYAEDLKKKFGMDPDMALLTKVTIGCGPAIYNQDASTVAASQQHELETVKDNFLIKKLGLPDGPELMDAINQVIETYGKSERNKYRAVVYYMLTKHFGKEKVYQ